jgi:hypothetical protein
MLERVTRGFLLVLTLSCEAACLSWRDVFVSAAATLSVASRSSANQKALCAAVEVGSGDGQQETLDGAA